MIDNERKSYIGACAIFKHETPFLREWIEFHRIVGVERFWMFNNDDDTSESDRVLAPYMGYGFLKNIHWPGRAKQFSAYAKAFELSAIWVEWLAVLDMDEFLFPVGTDSLQMRLREYDNPKIGALAVNWQVFGSSGIQQRQPLVIDAFKRRADERWAINGHVKSVVRPSRVLGGMRDPHLFSCKPGFITVNENGKTVISPKDNEVSVRKIRINHYFTRSREDFGVKIKRGRADTGTMRNQSIFSSHDRNEVYDDSACRFLPLLKERLSHEVVA